MNRQHAIGAALTVALVLTGCANSVALTADVGSTPEPIEALPGKPAEPDGPAPVLTDQFLLPPEAMPAWPGNTGWTQTGNVALHFGDCPLPDLLAFEGLGALNRTFIGAGDLAGIHIVGDFGDPARAATANVLVTDQLRDCPGVTPLTSLISGSTWVLRTPGDPATVAYFAVDYVGRYLTLIAFRTSIAGTTPPGDPIAPVLATATGQLPPR